MSYRPMRFEDEKFGSQKDPLDAVVNSRFGREIKVGDPVVTFAQSGRATSVGEGIFKGIINVDTYRIYEDERTLHYSSTFYVVERPDGKRTRLHYEESLCHADVTVRDLIGHSI